MLVEIEKIALITGAGVRIGRFVAKLLANDGWKIALHYNKSENQAYELAREILPITDVILFKADLSNHNEAENLIKKVNEQLGPVSLLINNASIYKNDNISNLEMDLLKQNINLHLISPVILAKAIAEQGIGGNIINIIDSDITKNLKKFFSYSLTKKALFELTKMLALSLAPDIRVNAIAPGAILFKAGQNKELFDQFIEDSPLKK
ncbi:MAG: SDR family NAD(P)-dependent oxidoreductase, partial [Pseudomonadota bacterium]